MDFPFCKFRSEFYLKSFARDISVFIHKYVQTLYIYIYDICFHAHVLHPKMALVDDVSQLLTNAGQIRSNFLLFTSKTLDLQIR